MRPIIHTAGHPYGADGRIACADALGDPRGATRLNIDPRPRARTFGGLGGWGGLKEGPAGAKKIHPHTRPRSSRHNRQVPDKVPKEKWENRKKGGGGGGK